MHPDLPKEQAFLDKAYRRLEEMKVATSARMEEVLDQGRGGTHQARLERDVIVRDSLVRLEQLEIGEHSLIFGRIDTATEDGDGSPEAYHIGRVGVLGADMEPLVVDWRAPVAEPFYRATGRHPMGLRLRRHFASEGRRIVGLEDEVFGTDGLASEEPTGALLAALGRSRSAHMRDIVATIQKEQDEVVRAPLHGLLVVQGGPGTGKTAVALHRAAYLLYTYRFPLERQRVLVVGPNQVFLRYIEQVLPSLGESGVILSTVDGLVSRARVRSSEDSRVARLKGDARMADLIAKAVSDRERPLRGGIAVPLGLRTLRLQRQETALIVSAARRRRGSHNARRSFVERLLIQRLISKERAGREPDPEAEEDLAEALREHPAVLGALDRMWPRLSAEELLHDLFGAPALLALAGGKFFKPQELAMLERARSSSFEEIPWTSADLALLDEAAALLGPRRGKGSARETRTYGHIVLDEAQELSAMQLRVISRRSLSGSMTVVGDLAQASGPAAPESWGQIARHLAPGRQIHLVQLGVNYRTPGPIADLAAEILAHAAPGLLPPKAVRQEGSEPQVLPAVADRARQVREAVEEALGMLDGRGTVGVVAPYAELEGLGKELGLDPVSDRGGARRMGEEANPVMLLPLRLAKGLEFDVVVMVEPSLLMEEEDSGPRALYVALTRATRHLVVVASDLPRVLRDALAARNLLPGQGDKGD